MSDTNKKYDFIKLLKDNNMNLSYFSYMYIVWNKMTEEEQACFQYGVKIKSELIKRFTEFIKMNDIKFENFAELYNLWIKLECDDRVSIYRNLKQEKSELV